MQVTKPTMTPPGNRRMPLGLGAAILVLAAALAIWALQRPQAPAPTAAPPAAPLPTAGLPAAPAVSTAEMPAIRPTPPAVTITSRDGRMTFRVPEPGDPEYGDYLEMLQHPSFRSSAEGRPGYAMPYDPEWRSLVAGKRQVSPMHYELSGGAGSMEQLAAALLAALRANDSQELLRLRVAQRDFETLLWPEFPQSRPYLRIDPHTAWGMHHTSSASAVPNLLRKWGGQPLELIGIEYGDALEYTNFTLYKDVKLRVRGAGTVETVEITEVPAIVGCNGQFKAYTFGG